MRFLKTPIPGCTAIWFDTYKDKRGEFTKTFHEPTFRREGLDCDFRESFVTTSGPNVLRGMHVQLPPADHAKLVYCLVGRVQDVVLDIRVGSPQYGHHWATSLSGESPTGLYIPQGVAHGFFVESAPAVIVYHVTSAYSPDLDGGVAWNSFGAKWPCTAPTLSEKDASLPNLAEFSSPFCYEQ
jgi:dTDP-4-dehydrorhamnose 3,5-epimerase